MIDLSHPTRTDPPRDTQAALHAARTPPMHAPSPGADTDEPGTSEEPGLPTQQPVEPDTGAPPREGEV